MHFQIFDINAVYIPACGVTPLAIANAIANGNATTTTNYRQHYISYFTVNNSITSPIMYLANSDFCIFGIILGSLLGYKK